MKINPFVKTSFAACLLAMSTASSASVWAPNDGDANFLAFSPTSFPFPSLSDTFGIFEDTANIASATPVVTFTGVGAVSFAASGSNYTVNTGTSSGTLLGSSNFQIGMLSGGLWSSAFGNANLGSDATLLMFADAGAFNNLHFLYSFDISPSQATSDGPSAVPLPASAWLMTSAVLGLLFTGRRKSNVVYS
ncbi:hypothetical protein ACH518_15900 [Methylomonas sp. HW2-6]|uniref:hypothetical protein n=1 Tax=Methylomonas TaxID=416 RepID=UPI00112A4F4D|nr:hypothetical protein [Methylomonas koyamae]TPQ26223.1 hypothetical protein C2U68_12345 [Methylomonas koyamae]